MLIQEAGYLLKVLFVKLEKRQAPEEGRNLNFSGFVFLIEIQNTGDTSYQILMLKKRTFSTRTLTYIQKLFDSYLQDKFCD